MMSEPTVTAAAASSTERSTRAGWLPRVEDWLLAGWVALVAPAAIHLQSSSGIFDPGRPLDGLLGIVAIAGAAVCLATGSTGATSGRGLGGSAAVGPFVGGLLLVALSTVSALELAEAAALAIAVAIAGLAVLARLRWPTLPTMVRRALVTPYVLVAGGLFWSAIGAVTSGGDLTAAIRQAAPSDIRAVIPIVGFLLAFSAVFYAMLVFAPRQVAEREGGPIAWVVRYALFVASVALGAGWLLLLGG
jgi:hypothetical protein